MTVLKVCSLTVQYEAAPVLWDISLDVPIGKFVGILGPNGAGKSTFLKALLGFIPRATGNVLFFGKKLHHLIGKIAYMPQRQDIDWNFPITVQELVLMGRYSRSGFLKWARREDKEAALLCLERVGMREYACRQIGKLSGGQQQRAFLARALFQGAEIYFLDEPLSGVDHASEEIIVNILKKMQEDKKTIFMVHHDLNSALKFFDWAILLNTRLVASGAIDKVFTPQLLREAYGKELIIYDEAMKSRQP
jgi:manganese/zinc/iron transport system ATP- binding protein